MDAIRRLLGSGVSLLATTLQLGVVAETWPSLPKCELGLCWSGGEPAWVEPFTGWEPYIDNSGAGFVPSSEPRCPGPQMAGTRYRLDHAPLPAGFNAHAFPDSEIIACVKLDSAGSVEAVRIVAGTGRSTVDRRLLRSILGQWRFRPVETDAEGPAWQRVRLNSGYGDQAAPDVPPPAPLPL